MPRVASYRAVLVSVVIVSLAILAGRAATRRIMRTRPASGAAHARPVVVFCYDDYSNRSSYEVDRAVLHAFMERGLQCTVAVVPCQKVGGEGDAGSELRPLSPERVDLLREAIEAGAVDVAQHGLTHLPSYRGQGSEFRGLPLERQIRRIEGGRSLLE